MTGISGWLREAPKCLKPLVDDISADVVVVGAGYSGLSTAIELRARGVDVVVVERDFAGSGASGRNAGCLVGGVGLQFDLLVRRLGRDGTAALVRFYDYAVRHVERLCALHEINCDYDSNGFIIAAVHTSQQSRVHDQVQNGREMGSAVRFLTHGDMRERGIPSTFLCGAFSEIGGTLDPGKYALGLRRVAMDAGVRLFEGSPVTKIEAGSVVRVRTSQGSVTANTCVLATNAYSPSLGYLGRTAVPVRVSAIETRPLSAERLRALGWSGREGIVTPHYLLESYRVTRRRTVLASTKHIGYLSGSRTPDDTDEVACRQIENVMRERLPAIGETPVAERWSGWVTFTADTIPLIGAVGEDRNVLYAIGCSGHGIGTQTLMGVLLAERAVGREHDLEAVLRREVPKFPPEPFRWATCKLLLSAARICDARVDRKVAATQRRATRMSQRSAVPGALFSRIGKRPAGIAQPSEKTHDQ